MKEGWKKRRLGGACLIKPPKSEAREKAKASTLVSFLPMEDLGIGIKLVKPSQTRQLSAVAGSYTYFADGDILLAKITPCFENGKLGIADELSNGIGFGSSEYIVLRPSAMVTKEWVYYFLSRKQFREEGAAQMTGAVGHKRIPKEFVEDYPLPIPPIDEQQQIVTLLDEAFAGLATAKENAERNLQNARSLFESHLESVFTRQGPGWITTSIGELVDDGVLAKPFDGNHGEIHPKKSDYTESGVPFVMARDLKDDLVDTRQCAYISRKQAESLRVGFAKDGDVLISHKGTIGRTAILRTAEDFIMLTPQVTAYRVTDNKRLDNRFARYYFMSPGFQREMAIGAADGSTRAYIGITKQLSLPFSFPALTDQQRIADRLCYLYKETQHLTSIYERKLAALDELKTSLLHQAFNGEL